MVAIWEDKVGVGGVGGRWSVSGTDEFLVGYFFLHLQLRFQQKRLVEM